jgi:hypothetical protein
MFYPFVQARNSFAVCMPGNLGRRPSPPHQNIRKAGLVEDYIAGNGSANGMYSEDMDVPFMLA